MESDRPSNADTSLPEPPKDAYESVPRRFTWRSSLFMALVLWLVLMFIVAECTVARHQREAGSGPASDEVRSDTAANAKQVSGQGINETETK